MEISMPPSLSPSPSHSSYREDIDGLRAIAVIAVLMYHMDKGLFPSGFIGVDIFFTISGYVVLASLLRKQFSSSTEYLGNFYARRMKRLAPSLVLVIIFASLLLSFAEEDPDVISYRAGICGLFGVSNIYYGVVLTREASKQVVDDDAGGYFIDWDERHDLHNLDHDPFTHTWSLGVEEQFYLVFPLVVLFAYSSRVNASNNPGDMEETLCGHPFWVFVALIVISMGISWPLSLHEQTYAFYLMPSRFWQLALGALVFEAQEKYPQIFQDVASSGRHLIAVELLTLALFVVAFLFTSPKEHFPFPVALIVSLATCLFVMSGHCVKLRETNHNSEVTSPLFPPPMYRILSHRFFTYLGAISYSLYLWHWPIYVFFRLAYNLNDIRFQLAAVGFSVILSVATHHFIELPIRNHPVKKLKKVYILTAVGLSVAAVFIVLLNNFLTGTFFLYEPDETISSRGVLSSKCDVVVCNASTSVNATTNTWCDVDAVTWSGCSAPRRQCDCSEGSECNDATSSSPCFVEVPLGEQREVTTGGANFLSYDPCLELTRETKGDLDPLVENCLTSSVHGDENSVPVVYLIGDSHASMYVPAFSAALNGINASLVYTAVGHLCGFNSDAFLKRIVPAIIIERCRLWFDEVNATLTKNIKEGDIVAVCTAVYKYTLYPAVADMEFDIAFLRDLAVWLDEKKAYLLVLDDGPRLPGWGYHDCRSEETKSICTVSKSSEKMKRHNSTVAFETLEAKHNNTFYFQIFDEIGTIGHSRDHCLLPHFYLASWSHSSVIDPSVSSRCSVEELGKGSNGSHGSGNAFCDMYDVDGTLDDVYII